MVKMSEAGPPSVQRTSPWPHKSKKASGVRVGLRPEKSGGGTPARAAVVGSRVLAKSLRMAEVMSLIEAAIAAAEMSPPEVWYRARDERHRQML